MKRAVILYFSLFSLVAAKGLLPSNLSAAEKEPLNIAVMDPLAAQLACKCVAGFAQRDYPRLAGYLEKKLGMEVKCAFSESLAGAQRDVKGSIHLVVGKDSIVRCDAKQSGKKLRPLAALTDKEGKTTFTGLFVVPRDSKAKEIEDLAGYKIFFGAKEAVEKSAAAIGKLRDCGVKAPEEITRSANCTEAAFAALEADAETGAAAVISSYAITLLEGCNTIEPGSLRVIGRTDPVPFIRVFATDALDKQIAEKVKQALFQVHENPELLKRMESKRGFIPLDPTKKDGNQFALHAGWPQWRGPNRDARVKYLPKKLPQRPRTVWEVSLNSPGLAGIAADENCVIVADRDEHDQADRFLCLAAGSGKKLWELTYAASAKMDYGCAPRATPLLIGEVAILLGAMGDLHAVRLSDGQVVWKKSFPTDFDAMRPTWGWCGSPILADGNIILQPGSKEASVVALDPATGKAVWKTSGAPTGYSSFIAGTFGGRRQLVGYDETSLGGWDVKTGQRLWRLVPPEKGDFNVPTPVNLDGRLVVTTENNGTRIYRFSDDGTIDKTPLAQNFDLVTDMSTAVISGGRLFGAYDTVLCLENKDLKTATSLEVDVCDSYASLIASEDRVLVITMSGDLVLVDTYSAQPQVVSQVSIFDEMGESYSHPALVGTRLYLRSGESIRCVELSDNGIE